MRRERGRSGEQTAKLKAIVALLFITGVSMSCTSLYEVPIEVPISAKLDVSKYNRVLVASFLTQTTEDLDLDAETTRLLRNQLRMTSNLHVIDAELEPLGDFSEPTLEETGKLEDFERLKRELNESKGAAKFTRRFLKEFAKSKRN